MLYEVITVFPAVDEPEDVGIPDRLGVRLAFPGNGRNSQDPGRLPVDRSDSPPVRNDDYPLRQVLQKGRKPRFFLVQLAHTLCLTNLFIYQI